MKWLLDALGISREEREGLYASRSMASTRRVLAEIVEKLRSQPRVEGLRELGEAILKAWAGPSEYLDARGVSREVQEEMKTGVDLHHEDLVDGQRIEQPRLVIPVFFRRKLRGLTLRKLDPRQAGPKYVHTLHLPKNRVLYHFDDLRDDEVVVVESPMSVLYLMSIGYRQVVATFGASVSDDQVELLRNFDTVVIFPDGDQAGYGGATSLAQRLRGKQVYVIDHGIKDGQFTGLDPADMSREELGTVMECRTPTLFWNPDININGTLIKNERKRQP